jgi:D-alanyl-lipoteichoic acid acyltransferase DltB (MBOAT superfamily)
MCTYCFKVRERIHIEEESEVGKTLADISFLTISYFTFDKCQFIINTCFCGRLPFT